MNETKRPKVSVIIPTYNRANSIGECVESVLKQSISDYEIIVVDDGSSDHTRQVLERYRSQIRYLYQGNRGPSCSRNKGISEARGDLVAFLDSDDLWLPEKLEKTIPVMEVGADVGLVFTNVLYQDDHGNVMRSTEYGYATQDQIRNALMERTLVVTSSAMVRKRILDNIGLFDEDLTYGEDWDLFYRIVRKHEAKLVKDKLTVYRISHNSMLANPQKREKLIQDTSRVVERIYSYPENVHQVRKKRKFYARYYRELGASDLVNGNPKGARALFLSSLNHEWVNPGAYGLIVKSYLWNTSVYQCMRRLRRTGGEQALRLKRTGGEGQRGRTGW